MGHEGGFYGVFGVFTCAMDDVELLTFGLVPNVDHWTAFDEPIDGELNLLLVFPLHHIYLTDIIRLGVQHKHIIFRLKVILVYQ